MQTDTAVMLSRADRTYRIVEWRRSQGLSGSAMASLTSPGVPHPTQNLKFGMHHSKVKVLWLDLGAERRRRARDQRGARMPAQPDLHSLSGETRTRGSDS